MNKAVAALLVAFGLVTVGGTTGVAYAGPKSMVTGVSMDTSKMLFNEEKPKKKKKKGSGAGDEEPECD